MVLEWLTRATIWLAMAGWVAGIALWGTYSRFFWTVGGILYLLHILFAYAGYYDWSHQIAWEKTASDTAEMTGFDTGIGLILNFLFAAWLGFDLWMQWVRKVRGWTWLTEFLVLFFILNGAIAFGSGAVVIYGIVLSVIVVVSWISSRKKRGDETQR